MTRVFSVRGAMAAFVLTICGVATTARAQDTATTNAPAVTADKTAQPEVKADWTTFAKAIGAVYGSVTFGYDADTDISLTAKGMAVKGKQKTKFLAQRPDKVRSEVQMSLGDDLKDARKYISLTDGTTYWVNRLDKPRYSATPADKVDLSKEMTAMGVLGALYLNRDLMGGLSSLTDETAEQILPKFKEYGIQMSKGAEMLDGKSVPVYTMNLTALKMNIKFFVDTVSSNLSRVVLSGKDDEKGFEIKVTERLTKIDRQPMVKDSLFAFTPMAGLEKAEDRIPVDLFKE